MTKSTMSRLALLLLFALTAAGAFVLALRGGLSWASLAAHQAQLRGFAAANPAGAAAAYVLAYCAVVALSVPGGGILTIAGGLMFGPWLGGALAVCGAGSGAVALFVLARFVFGAWFARRFGPFAARLQEGLARDGFNYLLALRLVPVVPFWLVNLAPALLGMRLLPYVGATVLGIIPATLVFAGIGAGLADVLAAGRPPDSHLLFTPHIFLPLLGLALLALLPALWRRRKRLFA